jgi:hypothetical protein
MAPPDDLRRLQPVLSLRQVKVQQAHVGVVLGGRSNAFLRSRHRRPHIVPPRLEGDREGFNQNPVIVAQYETHRSSR